MNLEAKVYFDSIQDFLRDTLRPLDERIDAMDAWVKERQDADPEIAGFYADDIDHLIGLGFVTYQRYITATVSVLKLPKKQALDIGPHFASTSIGYAAIVNAAANYWKHHDEWDASALKPDACRVVETLTNVGVNTQGSLVVTNILQVLGVTSLAALVPQMAEWHELCGKSNE